MKYQLIWVPPSDEIHVADCDTFDDAVNTPHNADEIVDDGKWQIHVLEDEYEDLIRVYELQMSEWKIVEDYMEDDDER